MNVFKLAPAVLLCMAGSIRMACAQSDSSFKSISLNNLDAFSDPPKNWIVSSDAVADLAKPQDIKPVKGEGAVVDILTKNDRMHLYTKNEFSDLQVELDFMMAKNSNSGVYLMGRYEVQLLDSWTRLNTAASDLGGVYMRWDPQHGTYEGTPPLMNVARAPGLWQHLSLKFRAPKFDDKGQKISNARFDEVYMNGVLVQQVTSVTGPTASSMFTDEKPKGPLVLQGDHGPVAFKNIRYRELSPEPDSSVTPPGDRYWETRNPIVVNPEGKPRMLRSFMQFGDKKLTHVVSFGDPVEVNYSYDIKTGAVFQVWRGQFLDVTRMWEGRGEPQLSVPLGSVIKLSDAPAVAVLAADTDAWPDTVSFDEVNSHGYTLDKKRSPKFNYSIKGTEVSDSIVTQSEGITRTITLPAAPANAYIRVAESGVIENISGDLYAVNGKSYYIRVDKKYKPVIRELANRKELLVKYDAANPLTYSIIW